MVFIGWVIACMERIEVDEVGYVGLYKEGWKGSMSSKVWVVFSLGF